MLPLIAFIFALLVSPLYGQDTEDPVVLTDSTVTMIQSGVNLTPANSSMFEFVPNILSFGPFDKIAQFQIRLKSPPKSPVTIQFQSDSVTFDVCTLNILPGNYKDLRKITITSLDKVASATKIQIRSTSADTAFNGQCAQYPIEVGNKLTGKCSARGDPHIVTFDGVDYTSKGSGIFYMVKANDFSVQTIIGPCLTYHGCTIGFAIRYRSSAKVITIDDAKKAFNPNVPKDVTPNVDGIKVSQPNGTALFFNAGPYAVKLAFQKSAFFNVWVNMVAGVNEQIGGFCNSLSSTPGKFVIGVNGSKCPTNKIGPCFKSWAIPDADNIFKGKVNSVNAPVGKKCAIPGGFVCGNVPPPATSNPVPPPAYTTDVPLPPPAYTTDVPLPPPAYTTDIPPPDVTTCTGGGTDTPAPVTDEPTPTDLPPINETTDMPATSTSLPIPVNDASRPVHVQWAHAFLGVFTVLLFLI